MHKQMLPSQSQTANGEPQAASEIVAVPLTELRALIARAQQRWMTIGTAARHSDLSAESIRRLIASGKLTASRPVKGRILIDRLELDSLIAGSTNHTRKGRGKR